MRDPRAQEDQAALWNGAAGLAWADLQELLDGMYRPFEVLLADSLAAGAGGDVLDVGCGAGATTLAIARRIGPRGSCTGIDLSQPLIDVARARAQRAGFPVTFLVADAASYAFEADGFDRVVSRFGVMFFDDTVRAFANLRRATRAGGELDLVVWRRAEDNPFMTTAERAAAPLLPSLPARVADGPGQFAFADARRVRDILSATGWGDVDVAALDVACAFPSAALELHVTRLGPVGRALAAADPGTRGHVLEVVRAAFEPYVHGSEVRFTAACWRVRGRAR